MRFQEEFARFHAAIEATLLDSSKSREGFDSAHSADDALRVLEDRVTGGRRQTDDEARCQMASAAAMAGIGFDDPGVHLPAPSAAAIRLAA